MLPVAIVGIGCRFPGGIDGPESFWNLLENEAHTIRKIPAGRWDPEPVYDSRPRTRGRLYSRHGSFFDEVDLFDADFFGISSEEASRMDPQQRLLLEVSWEALDDAGLTFDAELRTHTGVFVGLLTTEYEELLHRQSEVLTFQEVNGATRYGTAGRISSCLGLGGASFTVDAACSSSLLSVHLACQSLRAGECSMALAGGANLILGPERSISLSQVGALSTDGHCRFADAAAEGYGRGEGAAMVVLRLLSDATMDGDRVYAVIRGSAVNNSGVAGLAMARPSVDSQRRVARAAYRAARVAPRTVGYVEANGAGRRAGDTAELTALADVLGERPDQEPCRIGSVKTNLAHTEGAAGAASLVKVALALHRGQIPASLHCEKPNPCLSRLPFRVQKRTEPWAVNGEPRRAGVHCFSLSGTNAHMVLEEAPPASEPVALQRRSWLLPISARSHTALRELARGYCKLLNGGPDLGSICFTAARRRRHLEHRLAVVGDDCSELVTGLQAWLSRQPWPDIIAGSGGKASGETPTIALEQPSLVTDGRELCRALAARYASGRAVDWTLLYPEPQCLATLPHYPWQRQPHRLPSADAWGKSALDLRGYKDREARRRRVEERLGRHLDEILRRPANEPEPNLALIDLGLDSLKGLALRRRLEEDLGVVVPLATLFQSTSPEDLLELVLDQLELAAPHHRERSLPDLIPDLDSRFEPFPLTDIQQAYWVGRSGGFAVGGLSCQAYFEFDSTHLDADRLEQAWQLLIDRHDMLRAVARSDGRQQVLATLPPYHFFRLDLRHLEPTSTKVALSAMRRQMSRQVRPLDRWPLFDIRISLLAGERMRLHVTFDLFAADAAGLFALFSEWSDAYEAPESVPPSPSVTFRDYVLAERAREQMPRAQQALAYWQARLPELPLGPELPLARRPGTLMRPRFVRHAHRLDAERWSRFKTRAAQYGVTPTSALCAAFAEVLTFWSRTPRFTLNLTFFRRQELHPSLEEIIGEFTANVLLEIAPAGNGFAERAVAIQSQLATDLEQSAISGVKVQREWARHHGDLKRRPLAPIVFTSQLAHGSADAAPSPTAWLGELLHGISQTPNVWLDHLVSEDQGDLVSHWDAVDELFPPGLIDDMLAGYAYLLEKLADHPSAWQKPCPDLLPPTQQDLWQTYNASAVEFSPNTLHGGFLDQLRSRGDATAVIATDRGLNYTELHQRAGVLAHELRARGVGPGVLVAIALDKGWQQIVAALGTLYTGAAFLPLSTAWPVHRRRQLLADSQAAVVIGQADDEWPASVQSLTVDLKVGQESSREPEVVDDDRLAYVIYTSGSTGQPGGVQISHRGAWNTLEAIRRRFDLKPTDRTFALSSLSFDLAIFDVFGTLAAGGAVALPAAGGERDPAHWLDRLKEARVSVWSSVPALMELLVEYLESRGVMFPASLRLVLLSGDWIPVDLPERIRRLAPRPLEVVSLGGATEASIWSVWHPIDAGTKSWPSIPYGRPMPNQRLYVLDERLRPRPVGVEGRLYIGGKGLAQGYHRDHERTRERFLTHPSSGERLYSTGDLGRLLPSGEIEFLGRDDHQVKIRGQRIELGEVESVLAQHPEVANAVVSAMGPERQKRQLVAYLVAHSSRGGDPPTSLDLDEVRRFVATRLPAAMVPTHFQRLDELPLNANGKVDRKALPIPTQDTESGGAAEAVTPVDQRVQDIVGEILGTTLPADARLVQCGADSMALIRLLIRLHESFGFRPDTTDFFSFETVGEISRFYSERLSQTSRGSSVTLLDPADRAAWKARSRVPYLSDSRTTRVELPDLRPPTGWNERSSHRRFSDRPVTLEALSGLLACLRGGLRSGRKKRLYASAGNCYPVQAYLYVKPERVAHLTTGTWAYDAEKHQLVELHAGANLDAEIHFPNNQPLFDESAFSIFLVAAMPSIAPVYGEHGRDFALIEVGLVTQLLEMSAPKYQLGLCQIGMLKAAALHAELDLDDDHLLLHSLVGGTAVTYREGEL